MKHLLYILCLFVMSCDSGGNGACEQLIGEWVGLTSTKIYSDGCFLDNIIDDDISNVEFYFNEDNTWETQPNQNLFIGENEGIWSCLEDEVELCVIEDAELDDCGSFIWTIEENKLYLETAYNQIQEKADAMEDELKEKFLNYPIPKQIIEEYNKVFTTPS